MTDQSQSPNSSESSPAGIAVPAVPQHMHYPAAPTAPVPTGRISWALGFLAWIPLPFVGMLVAAVAMTAVYPSLRRSGVASAVENSRRAANWGLTLLTVIAVCGIYVLVLAVAFPETHEGFFPIGVAVVAFGVLTVVHAVVTIAGTVISGKRVFRNRLAIPYLRSTR